MSSHTLLYHYPVCVTILLQNPRPVVQRHYRAAEARYISSAGPPSVRPTLPHPPTLNALVDSTPEQRNQHPLGKMSLWAGTLEMWAIYHWPGVV